MTAASRTVAILAPDFPPSNLPSSIRARLFASHLAEFGWQPVVITTSAEHYAGPLDPDNEKLLPPDLEIIRTGALPARWMRRLGVGDVGMRSLWHHWRALRKLTRSRRVDLLFITVPPCVPMILGRLAYHLLRLPYVIDYQDPWITEVYWHVPKSQRPPKWPLAYAMARLLEPFAIRHAAHITGVSDGTSRDVLSRYPHRNIGSTTLPFGAEPADFDYLKRYPRRNGFFARGDGSFHIVYAGVCIPGMFPALRAVFGGLCELRKSNPDLSARVRLHFIGTNYAVTGGEARVRPIAAEYGLEGAVDETPARVPYLDALQLLLDADALLILGTNEPHYTASKIYPYALAGKPILAILHGESSAVESLAALTPARILTFDAEHPAEGLVDQAKLALEALESDPLQVPDRRRLAEHSAVAMTRKLAAVFEEVMATS